LGIVRALERPTRSGTGPSDAALVLSARDGESWAQEALFRRHASMVNGLAYRLMGRDADVDDIVQEAFVQAFQSLRRLQDPQSFAKWLGSIVVHVSSKNLRRRKLLTRLGLRRSSEPIDVEAAASHTAGPEVMAELRRVYQALERLPVDLRVALVLRNIEGMSLDEVATALGVSLATAKRRIAAAEEQLANKLAGRLVSLAVRQGGER
jgi:RNA polymerase sigma-70 factor (ECF subfamily)